MRLFKCGWRKKTTITSFMVYVMLLLIQPKGWISPFHCPPHHCTVYILSAIFLSSTRLGALSERRKWNEFNMTCSWWPCAGSKAMLLSVWGVHKCPFMNLFRNHAWEWHHILSLELASSNFFPLLKIRTFAHLQLYGAYPIFHNFLKDPW